MARLFRTSYIGAILVILCRAQLALSTLNTLLDINGTFPYLIDRLTGQLIEPRDYLDFDNIYTPNDTYRLQQTAQGRNYHLLKAFDFANYYQSDYWHYSSKEDLRQSALPVANAQLCASQLNWLERKLNSSKESLFQRGHEHINLMTLVDSFGRPEANSYLGHNLWLGSHFECVRANIDMALFELEESCHQNNSLEACELARRAANNNKQAELSNLKGRYCLGKAHELDWPNQEQDNYTPRISYKIGLCLPETCETLSYETHKDQLERLMRFNMPDYMKNRISLHDLYCLPDPRSPIRKLSLQSKVFIALNGLWIICLAAATIVFACFRANQHDLNRLMMEAGRKETAAKLISGCDVKGRLLLGPPSGPHEPPTPTVGLSLRRPEDSVEQLSTHSYKSSSASLALWLSESPLALKIIRCLSVTENLKEFTHPPLLMRDPNSSQNLRINLNSLDFIKCLCCIMVIFGHIIFIHMQHIRTVLETIEISYEVAPRILIAFFNFVDTFFIISGMLTAYFIFKRFNATNFSNPIIWAYVSLHRLVRLSPIYLLIFWFAKTVSVHLYDGPIWDYGTDRNSMRGLCINDHWWKSILYLGNVGSMQPLCILPAWSIIVDAQYSLVIPPLLYLMLRYKRLAYLLLLMATIVSTAKMSLQLATQTAVKTADMAKVRLHVYPLISRFAAEFYNTAWNRIGPVAIGIVGGHMLHLYDVGKIRRWPWFMRDNPFKLILLMHLFIFIMPTLGKFTDDPRAPNGKDTNDADLTLFLLSNATIKPIWSIINTILLLRLVTDLKRHSVCAKLVSHNIWHCLGKLCFISYLIHYELILILLKSKEDGHLVANWSNALREFSLIFMISTFLSYVIYILYEAPINKLTTLLMSKPAYAGRKEAAGTQPNQTNLDEAIKSNPAIMFTTTNGEIKLTTTNNNNSAILKQAREDTSAADYSQTNNHIHN